MARVFDRPQGFLKYIDFYLRNKFGKSLQDIALIYKRVDVLKLALTQASASIDNMDVISFAIRQGDIILVKALIKILQQPSKINAKTINIQKAKVCF